MAPREEECFGLCLSRELDDCATEIMAVFGVSDFFRDYEDTWEWVEGDGPDGLNINLARTHNWMSGAYDIPVVVRVSGPATKLTNAFLIESAQRLANSLKTEVWIGTVLLNEKGQGNVEFKVEQRFTPDPQRFD